MFSRRRDLLAVTSLLGSVVLGCIVACAASSALGALGAPGGPGDGTLMWGIHRGCEPDAELTAVVREKLEGATFPTTSLGAVRGVGSPVEAALEVKRVCGVGAGRVLGGTIEPDSGGGFERVRLWLVEISTGQVASVDGVCAVPGKEPGKEPGKDKGGKGLCKLADEVGWKAMELLDKPRFGVGLSETPSYCEPPAPAVGSGVVRSKRVTLVVQGPAGFRQAVTGGVQREAGTTGRQVVVWKGDAKRFFGYELLHKMLVVQGEPNGQILGVSSTGQGATVWVFDGPSDQTYPAQIECPKCSVEALAEQAATRGVALLDQVTGSEVPRPVPPAGSCEPFVLPQCKQVPPPAVLPAGVQTNRSTGKSMAIKGGLWGLFAASAAAGVTLAILNETSVGDRHVIRQNPAIRGTFHQTLTKPAWGMGAVAGLSLAVAIPTTLWANRASSKSTPATTASGWKLVCPTQ